LNVGLHLALKRFDSGSNGLLLLAALIPVVEREGDDDAENGRKEGNRVIKPVDATANAFRVVHNAEGVLTMKIRHSRICLRLMD